MTCKQEALSNEPCTYHTLDLVIEGGWPAAAFDKQSVARKHMVWLMYGMRLEAFMGCYISNITGNWSDIVCILPVSLERHSTITCCLYVCL